MRIRVWIRSFFGFSRSETNGFLILLPLMAALVFSAPVYRWWLGSRPDEVPENTKILDSLVASWKWNKPADSVKESLFTFDPNTASPDDLKNLGFTDGLSHRIMNYRAKGGKFKIKRDLRKLYGMDSILMARLYSYIDLPEKINSTGSRQYPANAPPSPRWLSGLRWAGKATVGRPVVSPTRLAPFDLNLADTAQLIQLYGIGSKLSRRILTYRDRLGGFISQDQLTEVYGLDSVVINQLKKRTFIREDFRPRQINVNAADEKELSSLPYIKLHLAKSIAAYRFQHGDFASIEELRQIALMNASLFQKIKPYLTVKD